MAIWAAGRDRMMELHYNCFIIFFSQYVVVTPTWCLCRRETQEDSIQKEQKIHFWRKTLRTPSHLSTTEGKTELTVQRAWSAHVHREGAKFTKSKEFKLTMKQRGSCGAYKKVDMQNGTQTNDLDVEHCLLTKCTSQIGISRDNDLIFTSFSRGDI